MEHLAPDVWIERIVAEGFPMVSAVVLAATRAFVIDTLLRPQDMRPVLTLLRDRGAGRRVVVVNTHHHWDHVYGNAAFPGVDIAAQRACPRLMQAQATTADESIPLQPPEGVPLPTVTFGDRLTYDDDRETVHLLHAPGHTEDSLVVFLANAGILFGGDTVEWPLPNFTDRDAMETWVRTLRQLKQLPVELVVPSHGPPQSKSILDANERYILGVYEAVAEAKSAGVGRHALVIPVARVLGEGIELDATYAAVHEANLKWAWDEV